MWTSRFDAVITLLFYTAVLCYIGLLYTVMIFCEKKNLTDIGTFVPFLFPLQENGFLSLQFIQLRIYSSAKSTIWYSPSLFFSPWSKSNHSKWLLMVIIATALYWSSGSMKWKQTKCTENQRGCSSCTIIFGLFIWPVWKCYRNVLG